MASIPQAPGDRSPDLRWVHRTAEGIEYGGDTPTGSGVGPLGALLDAISTTWDLRKTLWLIVVYDFKSRYRAQSLGMFWSLANPLVMMAVLSVAFTQILRIGIPHFPIFYLIGGVQWHFFNGAVVAATHSLTSNSDLVKRTTLPRHFAPLAAVLSNGINLGMELIVLFGFYFVFPEAFVFGTSLFFLPVILALLFFLTLGFGLICASAFVKFRDTQYIVSSALMVFFWLTPILYSTEMAPPWIANFLRLNPLAGLIEGARAILMQDQIPELGRLAPAILASVLVMVFGGLVFRKTNLTVADYV